MIKSTNRIAWLVAASLLAFAGAAPADDTEIFQGVPNTVSAVRPNILFIFDTSGSMGTLVATQPPYTPSTVYSGICSTSNVYFLEGNASLPTKQSDICKSGQAFPAAAFQCDAAKADLAGTKGSYYAIGAAKWNAKDTWKQISSSSKSEEYVECKADAGKHGGGSATALWAADGKTIGPWTSTPSQQISWTNNNTDKSWTFYSANYLNWYYGSRTVYLSRLQIMQQTATQLVDDLVVSDNVNVGLMRFDRNAEGGMVLREVKPVAENATNMKSDIAALDAGGNTPLSETMYEAYLYLSGSSVRFGNNSSPVKSVASSRVGGVSTSNVYQSPLVTSCQKTFIVLLTDGEPTADNSADGSIEALRGGKSCKGSGAGRCLEEIAQYMYENDVRTTLADLQNVTTYTIGFGDDVAGSVALRNTAKDAGGEFFVAGDTASLTAVLTNIVRAIISSNTAFTAPAVSVNAFNRTQNLNDLYVSVFKPTETFAWYGNVKKYRLSPDGTILDANDRNAVDPATGFLRSTAQSYWSPTVDGDVARNGGAASQLPTPATRKVYSNLNPLDPYTLTSTLNAVVATNALITESTLGLAPLEVPGTANLINWLRGADIDDRNGDGSTTDPRFLMGDPMHGRPATVIYGGTAASPDANDGVIYAVTNEGFLHAIDIANGSELWAFMPRDLMPRTRNLYQNPAAAQRNYGLDGNVRTFKYDVNNNGVVEPADGDRVLVFVGMRRGGQSYYGFDVTDRNQPRLLWKIGANETGSKQLPGAGQSWSTPTVARVKVAGQTQNSLNLVLVIGGGYDTVQDNDGAYALDSVGNRVFMVDAFSGDRLWYAAINTDLNADLKLASMTHSIPGDVRVIDLTGDGFADRMYAADMGGRVWRFDIASGQPKNALVTGGVFASLGNAHLGSHPVSSTRRFYNAPDVAFVSQGGRNWLNIALGSGYRGHPLNLQTQDRFYSLRDYRPYARLTQTQYDDPTATGALVPIKESDAGLIDITNELAPVLPSGAEGWRLDLRQGLAWTGEKVLSEARTFQNVVQFTTYEPNPASTTASTSCSPAAGKNRLYSISTFNGAPVYNRDNPSDPPDSTADRITELAQTGIAPEVVWLFPSPDNPTTCAGEECRPQPVCLVGFETCGAGVNLAPVRTFWRQNGIN